MAEGAGPPRFLLRLGEGLVRPVHSGRLLLAR